MSENAKKRKLSYIKQYDKEHYKVISLKLNTSIDSDIIEHLETVDNKSEAIKQAIREQIQKHK